MNLFHRIGRGLSSLRFRLGCWLLGIDEFQVHLDTSDCVEAIRISRRGGE